MKHTHTHTHTTIHVQGTYVRIIHKYTYTLHSTHTYIHIHSAVGGGGDQIWVGNYQKVWHKSTLPGKLQPYQWRRKKQFTFPATRSYVCVHMQAQHIMLQ